MNDATATTQCGQQGKQLASMPGLTNEFIQRISKEVNPDWANCNVHSRNCYHSEFIRVMKIVTSFPLRSIRKNDASCLDHSRSSGA